MADGRTDRLVIDRDVIDGDPGVYLPRTLAGYRIEVHDRTTQALIEILERAYKASYDLQVNAASVGSFMLPRDDPKWPAIVPFREVWMYDALEQLVDVFRIAPLQERRDDQGTTGLVKLEGYACALQDDIIPAELIFTNQTVTAVLTTLLSYQAVMRVTLGTVDAALDKLITTRVSYVNIMRACWEVRNIVGGFISVDAATGNPAVRTLNLRADPGQDIGQRVQKGFNLRGLAKVTESQAIVTKVWALGRGEGRSQQRPSTDLLLAQPATFAFVGAGARSTLALTDRYSRYKGWTALGAALPNGVDAFDTRVRPTKVYRDGIDDTANWQQGVDERTFRSTANGYNPGASIVWTVDYVHAEYLIADDTTPTYGTLANTFVDKNYESSDSLVKAARTYLDGVKTARLSHEVAVNDVARIYPEIPIERLHLYDKIKVFDPDLGVTTKDRIVACRYGDLQDPTSFTILVTDLTLADLAPRAAAIADRVRKYENQPDGATTLYGPDSFEDNIDAAHPYTRNIEIPSEAISILALKLRMRTKAYRYYVAASTSSSTGTPHVHTVNSVSNPVSTNNESAFHTHTEHDGFGTTVDSNGHTHAYGDSVPTITNTETNVGGHTHVITTTLTPGIVETTTPTQMNVAVDGNAIPGTATSLDEFDITPYLTRNADGSIVRGLHTVSFTPNMNGRVQATIKGLLFLQSRGVIVG